GVPPTGRKVEVPLVTIVQFCDGKLAHEHIYWDQASVLVQIVRGWTVCRFHGAHGGAPKGKANGAYKHGLYTAEAKKERRLLADLLRPARKAIASPPREGEQ